MRVCVILTRNFAPIFMNSAAMGGNDKLFIDAHSLQWGVNLQYIA